MTNRQRQNDTLNEREREEANRKQLDLKMGYDNNNQKLAELSSKVNVL